MQVTCAVRSGPSSTAPACSNGLVATLRANLAAGDKEKAGREFTDGLNGPGTWEKRSALQKEILLANLGTGVDTGERGSITCSDIAKFQFPVLNRTGSRRVDHRAPEKVRAGARHRQQSRRDEAAGGGFGDGRV